MSSGGLYVPPHLRGRSATSSAPAGNSAPGSGSGSGKNSSGNNSSGNNSSRPKNAKANHNLEQNGGKGNERKDGKTSGPRRNSNSNSNSNPHRSRRNGKATAATAATASGGGSRWANVDRSSIEAGGHRRTNNNNNINNGASHQQQPSSNRNHHHRNNRNKHVRAIFFGDSFVKLFGLLNDYSDSVLKTPRKIQVHKYKAASAKGLCREGNKNRADIERVLHKLSKDAGDGPQAPLPYPNLERLVFCFGSVDVHMSYYFKKYVREEPLSDEDLREIARNFVDFVAGLEVPSPSQRPLAKIVVGIYPSPLSDEHVGASLQAYGSLETQDQVDTVDAADDRFMDVRQARVQLFNDALRERCEHHNNKTDADEDADEDTHAHARLEYHDVQDEVLAPADEEGMVEVKEAYKDVSDLNIHLVHETILQLWVEKWPWYKELTIASDRDHSTTNFLEYLQKTFDDYRKTKPWAERTHVAETMGVQLSAA
mmetsp:Transcript_19689/g.54981  ORF Transcript_19689/g.54981 Transcript_19689/m.54981 type:complete len:483 (-) Transcript_19689:513-1961(-)